MNAYLHIPFCASICSYCDFTSFAGQEDRISGYVRALCLEIEKSSLEGPLRTVYFGGGTPSLLPPGELALILSTLRGKAGFDPNAEVSLEANPETVDLAKLRAIRAAGVNRISFGAQSSHKETLKKLGRGHEWGRVREVFAAAREAGFDNLNLDLMLGLPGETPDMFRESLQEACALGPDHLSLYALQVEEGTPLARQVGEGLALPGENEVADEYAWAQGFLVEKGLEQYEVSNFAREGKTCRHNWNIWRGEDYWGFGVGAVGTVKGVRTSHGEDLPGYLRALQSGKDAPVEKEPLSDAVRLWEKILLGMRTKEGVRKEEVENYMDLQNPPFKEKIRLFLREGFLSLAEGRYRVTTKGYFVLNGILEAFMV